MTHQPQLSADNVWTDSAFRREYAEALPWPEGSHYSGPDNGRGFSLPNSLSYTFPTMNDYNQWTNVAKQLVTPPTLNVKGQLMLEVYKAILPLYDAFSSDASFHNMADHIYFRIQEKNDQ